MKIYDATPPADFPAVCMILDRMAPSGKCFYVRVQDDDGVKTTTMEGENTLPGAMRKAYAQGLRPVHFLDSDLGDYVGRVAASAIPKDL